MKKEHVKLSNQDREQLQENGSNPGALEESI